jgi:hypothetical protein
MIQFTYGAITVHKTTGQRMNLHSYANITGRGTWRQSYKRYLRRLGRPSNEKAYIWVYLPDRERHFHFLPIFVGRTYNLCRSIELTEIHALNLSQRQCPGTGLFPDGTESFSAYQCRERRTDAPWKGNTAPYARGTLWPAR